MKYIKYSFLSALLLLFALSCEKLERDNPLDGNQESEHDNTGTITCPVVTTNNATNITVSSAICHGSVTSDGGTFVTSKGICYSKTTNNPTIANSITNEGTGTGTFSCLITGLSSNTKYYYRAYATNNQGTSYGTTKYFTTSHETSANAFEFDSYSINFESINDYLITPGENLRIGINYIFNGSYPLSATFSISSTSSYVVCESGTAHLSGDGAYSHHPPTYPSSTSGFLVHIADNAPNGTVIPISVTIVDGTGNHTNGNFSLVVGSAWK